ncbi:MAG: hypothetical protein JW862_19190, partial [Anaerolineales bacterium]|nr:hypothetical protein [Anaerolineales bacterium]
MKRMPLFILVGLLVLTLAAQTIVQPAAAQFEPEHAPDATFSMAAVSAYGGAMQTFAIAGDYAYLSEGMRLVVLDISTPAAPVEVGRTLLPDMAWQIQVVGDYAYIAAWSKGLQVVDISDPHAPAVVGSWLRENSGSWAYAVAVQGNYAYLGGNDVIMVLDISNPAAPAHVRDIGGTLRSREMQVSGGHLYIAG